MESARGQLLIAGPRLLDPNFWRTVVLIVEHSDEGALGVVLNRPSETTALDAVSQLEPFIEADEPVFVGGPVLPSSLIIVAEFDDPTDAALVAFDDVGVLGAGAAPGEIGGPRVRRARAFVGHAGWGPGQLDGELERGDWILETRPARRRLRRGPQGALGRRAHPEGRQLRLAREDAAGPVGELRHIAAGLESLSL